MTVSAAKPEEKRLGWFVPTAVDQAESCVKPAAEGRNLARMGVVARIGCQVLTQAFATTTDMLNAA